ncbi:hypothetical protein JTB14_027986 [Gonioctena quinquepunctata]|nr:hypothetical protein JTB14_027986 [Gonioctena quinquepunctata]
MEGSKKRARIAKRSEVLTYDRVHQKMKEQKEKKDADERGEIKKRKSVQPDRKKTKIKTAEISYSSSESKDIENICWDSSDDDSVSYMQ